MLDWSDNCSYYGILYQISRTLSLDFVPHIVKTSVIIFIPPPYFFFDAESYNSAYSNGSGTYIK